MAWPGELIHGCNLTPTNNLIEYHPYYPYYKARKGLGARAENLKTKLQLLSNLSTSACSCATSCLGCEFACVILKSDCVVLCCVV